MGVLTHIVAFIMGAISGIMIMCFACAADSDDEEDE